MGLEKPGELGCECVGDPVTVQWWKSVQDKFVDAEVDLSHRVLGAGVASVGVVVVAASKSTGWARIVARSHGGMVPRRAGRGPGDGGDPRLDGARSRDRRALNPAHVQPPISVPVSGRSNLPYSVRVAARRWRIPMGSLAADARKAAWRAILRMLPPARFSWARR